MLWPATSTSSGFGLSFSGMLPIRPHIQRMLRTTAKNTAFESRESLTSGHVTLSVYLCTNKPQTRKQTNKHLLVDSSSSSIEQFSRAYIDGQEQMKVPACDRHSPPPHTDAFSHSEYTGEKTHTQYHTVYVH